MQLDVTTLDNCQHVIANNGKLLNNLRHADDTILIAESLDGLQTLVNSVADESSEFGISIDAEKSKYMIIKHRSISRKTYTSTIRPWICYIFKTLEITLCQPLF